MERLPTISVVITNYNYERYLAETIECVCAQSYAACEIVVVDDVSTDGSRELLTQLEKEKGIQLVFQPVNGGQWAGFRAGVEKCRGDIVAFLDADDLWDADYLKEVAESFGGEKSIDFLFTGRENFGESSGEEAITPRGELIHFGPTQVLSWLHTHWLAGPTSSCSISRPMAEDILAMNLDKEWRICADFGIQLAVGLLGGLKAHLPKPLMKYRKHSSNAWNHDGSQLTREYHDKLAVFQTMELIKQSGAGGWPTMMSLSMVNKCVMASLSDSLILEAQLETKPEFMLKLYRRVYLGMFGVKFSRRRKRFKRIKSLIENCQLKDYKI